MFYNPFSSNSKKLGKERKIHGRTDVTDFLKIDWIELIVDLHETGVR